MAGPVKAPPVEVPKLIDIARWLFIASACLGLVRVVAQLLDRETLVAGLRRSSPELGQDQVDASINGSIMLVLVISIAVLIAYTRLANAMARGRNWARVVLTVFAAASVLFGLLRLVAWASGLAAALGVAVLGLDLLVTAVTMVLDTIAVVLMYRESAHFRKRVTVDSTFLRS